MSGHKLLLADDSVTVQKVVQLTFAEEGIDVSICGDGDTAMLRYAEFQPDIVLADVNMPGFSGYEVCEKIKAQAPGIPVILLVGSFEPFDQAEADRVGADDSMTKPFQSIRQLIDVVQGLLRTGSDIPAVPAPAETAAAGFGYDTASWEASMAETKELPVYDDGVTLGDTGMDDDMIEATRPDYERDTIEILSPIEDAGPSYSEQAETSSEYTDRYVQEDHSEAETAPLVPPIDLNAGFASEEEAPLEDDELPFTLHRIMDDDEEDEQPIDETSQTLAAPVMELDDMNFLEIPVAGVPVLPPTEESVAGSYDIPEPGPTPEFIDEVVEKVLQRLSGDSLRDVVRDVVRKMSMEKTPE